MIAWMRRLEITLTSNSLRKTMSFGKNFENKEDDLTIDVNCYKYLSSLKDECTIQIKNLTQAEVVQIIQGKFYDVEVKCGYRSSGVQTIFKGGVLYVSTQIDDRKTNTVIILCASHMVAKYGQARMNLTLNSGINLFSALKFICKKAGIPNSNVSTQFKTKFLNEVLTSNQTVGSFFDSLCGNNQSYGTNSDEVASSVVSIFDLDRSDQRLIKLRSDNIILEQYPTLNKDGCKLNVMPTFNFMCGDIVEIDNSIIQIPMRDKSELSNNYGHYLDKEGRYMVYQMHYHLQNRGSQFKLEMLCKSRNLLTNVAGV